MTTVRQSPLAGRGDDDLLRAGGNMALGLLHVGEQAGGLDDEVHAQRLPRQFRRRLGADDFDLLAVDDEDVRIGVLGLLAGGGGLATASGEVLLSTVPLKRPWMESYLSRYARLSAGTISPTATTSMSLPTMPCSTSARNTRRPMRPNPLIATLTAIIFYPFLKKCVKNRTASLPGPPQRQ